jgi:hypothetical protein
MNLLADVVDIRRQKEIQDGLSVWYFVRSVKQDASPNELTKQDASLDSMPSQTSALAFTVENAVRNANHHGESLEVGIMSCDLADAHEEVLDALDVDAHDLWNEISDLLLLVYS